MCKSVYTYEHTYRLLYKSIIYVVFTKNKELKLRNNYIEIIVKICSKIS